MVDRILPASSCGRNHHTDATQLVQPVDDRALQSRESQSSVTHVVAWLMRIHADELVLVRAALESYQ